jgi:hypothetical protein
VATPTRQGGWGSPSGKYWIFLRSSSGAGTPEVNTRSLEDGESACLSSPGQRIPLNRPYKAEAGGSIPRAPTGKAARSERVFGPGSLMETTRRFRTDSAGAPPELPQHRVIWVTLQRNDPLLGRSSHPRPRNALVRGPSCSRESGCTSSSSTARSSRPAYATPAHASRRWSATANGTLSWMPAATTAPNWSARWGRT